MVTALTLYPSVSARITTLPGSRLEDGERESIESLSVSYHTILKKDDLTG